MSLTTIAKVTKLNKVFFTKPKLSWVLKNISLDIYEGEFIIFFGPSGCGKSTLLNLILGLDQATTGNVMLLDHVLEPSSEDKAADLRKGEVGIVYQQSNWIKSLNVIGNVAFPLILQGKDKATAWNKAYELLTKVGMGNWSNLNPSELSAGQQQKVALARALITDPEVIVADEPTGNLDKKSGTEIMRILKELNDQGKTILVVTHDQSSLHYATRIVQMLDGYIVASFQTGKRSAEEILIEIMRNDKAFVLDKSDEGSLRFAPTKKGNKQERRPAALSMVVFSTLEYVYKIFLALILLITYAVYKFWFSLFRLRVLPRSVNQMSQKVTEIYLKICLYLEKKDVTSIKYINLLELALKNIFYKKARAFITIGGVSIAIGFIVFLISIGYGIENLVVSRVATLNELRQIDVSPLVSSNVSITDDVIDEFSAISGVEDVLPMISAAGQVDYNQSLTDIVIYGVQPKYLDISDISFQAGGTFSENSDQLVVNQAFLEAIGATPTDVLGSKISLYIIIPPAENDENIQTSEGRDYYITGVVNTDEEPLVFLSIDDLRSTGEIIEYSQAKIVAYQEGNLNDIRRKLEFSGYRTYSVADTVAEVKDLFSSVRLFFGVLGIVSLFIGGLGMFNTLTVSLLERTREVGLMKAIGMKKAEIREMFLTESMTMGVIGGIFGVVLGILGGKLLSIVLSILSVTRGLGTLDISYVPLWFVILAILIAIVVGAVTGIMPAKRATQISPIDALRYE